LLGAGRAGAVYHGAVLITPASASLAPGNTITVSVDVTAPDGGLSVWAIKIGYDPNVVQVDTISGNPACQALNIPNPPGSGTLVQTISCDTTDISPANGVDETAVDIGGWVKNVNGTATGWSGTKTAATFTFKAVGSIGQSSPLTVNVCDEFSNPFYCDRFLGPAQQKHWPDETNGQITIANETSRKWGDVDCGSSVTVIDARKAVLAALGLPYTQPAGCPLLTDTRTVNGTPRKWGDVDCDGNMNVIDARKLVLASFGLPFSQQPGCPPVGTWVLVS
jgi:hypothetical protein